MERLYRFLNALGQDGESRESARDERRATLQIGNTVELNAQYLRRSDDDPFFSAAGEPTETVVDGGFAELIWSPGGGGGRWFLTGLVNWLEADAPVFTVRQGEAGPLERYRSGSLGANYLLRRNFRLLVEPEYDFDREFARLTVGFTAAF